MQFDAASILLLLTTHIKLKLSDEVMKNESEILFRSLILNIYILNFDIIGNLKSIPFSLEL